MAKFNSLTFLLLFAMIEFFRTSDNKINQGADGMHATYMYMYIIICVVKCLIIYYF